MKSIKVAENLSAGGAALRDDRISARNRCDRSLRQRRYEEAEARRLRPTNTILLIPLRYKTAGNEFWLQAGFSACSSKEPANDGHAI